MNLIAEEYAETNGLPIDKSYLECGLPGFLQESLEQMKEAWRKRDAGKTICGGTVITAISRVILT